MVVYKYLRRVYIHSKDMSRSVILSGREDARLLELEASCQNSFEKNGGTGDWQEVAKVASVKRRRGENLTNEEELVRDLAWVYYVIATNIHNDIFKG